MAARSGGLTAQNSSHAAQYASLGWSALSNLANAARENPR
jgi:hypothetical protein